MVSREILFDNRILNTMNTDYISAKRILTGTDVSVLDAARIAKNILDAKPKNFVLTDLQFCAKVIEVGLRHMRTKEMPLADGFALYLKSKQHLRPDSIRDIRCIGNRLLRTKPELGERNFSELSVAECEEWLNAAFHTNPQFNKARAMLHGLFEFAIRREWCDKNPIKLIERRRIIEKEISPLTFPQIKNLLKTAKMPKHKECLPAIGLLMFAGVRPREVHRITWKDIDLEENSITIHSLCSKTGGVRQVEICSSLKRLLAPFANGQKNERVCPKNWQKRWRDIRNDSGFKNAWVQDILRHTYASYHAKRFKDLPRLQLNMGHYDLSLLRSRYVNMRGISHTDARDFFN